MCSAAYIYCCLNVNHCYTGDEAVHCPQGAAKVVLQPPDDIKVALQGTIGDKEVGVYHCLLLVNHLLQVLDRKSKRMSVKKLELRKRRRKGIAVYIIFSFSALSISFLSRSKLCFYFENLPLVLKFFDTHFNVESYTSSFCTVFLKPIMNKWTVCFEMLTGKTMIL